MAKVYTSTKMIPGGADNSAIFQKIIDAAKPKSWVVLPDGEFHFSKTIEVKKPLRFIGFSDTVFLFPQGVTGIRVQFIPSSGVFFMTDVSLKAKDLRHGFTANGLEIHAPFDLKDIFIKNFGGTGLEMSASVAEFKTDLSGSSFLRVQIAECGKAMNIEGDDANACCLILANVRDNDTLGIDDNSLLGNTILAPMAHNNKGGHYRSSQKTQQARTLWLSPYGEGDSNKPNIAERCSIVIGGVSGPNNKWVAPEPDKATIIQY